MKPLTNCPNCNSALIRKTIPEHLNHTKYENCSKRCATYYFQYYKQSYDELEVEYVCFNTPDYVFNIYIYFDHYMYKNLSHIYCNATTQKYGKSMPILYLPLDKYPLDLSDMAGIQKKISTLALFV